MKVDQKWSVTCEHGKRAPRSATVCAIDGARVQLWSEHGTLWWDVLDESETTARVRTTEPHGVKARTWSLSLIKVLP